MQEGPDDTVRILPAQMPAGQAAPPRKAPVGVTKPAGGRNTILLAAGLVMAVLLGGSVTAWVLFAGPRPAPAVASIPAPAAVWSPEPAPALRAESPAPAPPIVAAGLSSQPGAASGPVQRSIASRIIVPVMDEAALLAHASPAARMIRLRENPLIFILDFPNLDEQGAAMNRLAALVEKSGQPRDRLLDDAALARAIAEAGDTPATYYYGHNYRSADVERFFALAWRDRITLNAGEEWLRVQFATAQELLGPGVEFAILTVPAVEPRVDASMRAAILHHEIGHGHFFTRPSFAAHVHTVWREVLSESERVAFRRFLSNEGYDPQLEEVMVNETMAFTSFTPDRRFFNAGMVGLTEDRLQVIRAAFRAGF